MFNPYKNVQKLSQAIFVRFFVHIVKRRYDTTKHAAGRVIVLNTWFYWDLIRYETAWNYLLVPTERLELSRPKSQPPQGCVSTNSTTTAIFRLTIILS